MDTTLASPMPGTVVVTEPVRLADRLQAMPRRNQLGLGLGLLLVLGVLLGYPAMLYATIAAVWAGALVGVLLLATRRAGMRTELPFGSFWVVAAAVFILHTQLSAYITRLLWP